MLWAGVHSPRWNFSEKTIRAARCIRQNSMPIRSSGPLGNPSSQRSISHQSAHPSVQNGVLKARRWALYLLVMKNCR